jgi:hypothetical protein
MGWRRRSRLGRLTKIPLLSYPGGSQDTLLALQNHFIDSQTQRSKQHVLDFEGDELGLSANQGLAITLTLHCKAISYAVAGCAAMRAHARWR